MKQFNTVSAKQFSQLEHKFRAHTHALRRVKRQLNDIFTRIRCVCVCVCIYMCVYVHVCVRGLFGVCASVCVRLYVYMCVCGVLNALCVCVCVCVCLSQKVKEETQC